MKKLVLILLLLLVAIQTEAQVRLAWDAPSVTTNVAGYRMYRGEDGNPMEPVPGQLITGTSFTDTTTQTGKVYQYAVRAVAPDGTESQPSNTVQITIPVLSVPPQVTGATATCSPDGTKVTVSWDPTPTATNYYLRIDNLTDDWYTPAATDYYVDDQVMTSFIAIIKADTPYKWWVHGVNVGGYGSSNGGEFTCTPQAPPPPPPPPPPTNLSIELLQPVASLLNRGNITIEMKATNAAEVVFLVNNKVTRRQNGSYMKYTWKANQRGTYTLTARAIKSGVPNAEIKKTVTVR